MGKNKLVVANLKMNLTISEINDYLKFINKEINNPNVVICPTSIYIPYFLKQGYQVGLQNSFYESEGAYTGEISPKQAISMGVRYTLIGHSERRTHFTETDEFVNKKIKETLKYKMVPIMCVGETIEQRSLLRTERILKRQIVNGLREIDVSDLNNVYIAYEPVWAIGSGEVPSNEEISRVVDYIKAVVFEELGYDNIKVLYGGSVSDENIGELNKINNLSGYLVGGASLVPSKLVTIINEVIN